MARRNRIDHPDGAYFITFTCHDWLSLIDTANSYEAFYRWFEYLDTIHTDVLAYCIMPNHFHCILALDERAGRSLNVILSNGKRFIAYDIIKRIKRSGYIPVLDHLSLSLSKSEIIRKQKHKVFLPSFDSSLIDDLDSLHRVMNYIHKNPVSKGWALVDDWREYDFSSASFYELGKENEYVTDYEEWF